jgi:hypothetical protein
LAGSTGGPPGIVADCFTEPQVLMDLDSNEQRFG